VQETFGLAVVEAMAAGLPVVASDFDGYRDTVDDTVGVRVPTRWGADPGWLAAYGSLLYERPLHLLLGQSLLVDGRGLGAALSALVDDPRRRAALGARAALRARARFDWRAIVPQYEAVWRRLRERPREVPSDVGPLGLDFSRVFAGHPSAPPLGDDAPLRRAALADWLAERGGRYPVYPDLKNLIGDAEIHGVLRIADAPVSLGELRRAAQGLLADVPLGAVRADLLIGWLLKHGLIEPNE
jgi:hypothetical protein